MSFKGARPYPTLLQNSQQKRTTSLSSADPHWQGTTKALAALFGGNGATVLRGLFLALPWPSTHKFELLMSLGSPLCPSHLRACPVHSGTVSYSTPACTPTYMQVTTAEYGPSRQRCAGQRKVMCILGGHCWGVCRRFWGAGEARGHVAADLQTVFKPQPSSIQKVKTLHTSITASSLLAWGGAFWRPWRRSALQAVRAGMPRRTTSSSCWSCEPQPLPYPALALPRCKLVSSSSRRLRHPLGRLPLSRQQAASQQRILSAAWPSFS